MPTPRPFRTLALRFAFLFPLALAGCDGLADPSLAGPADARGGVPGPPAPPPSSGCVTGTQTSGALYEVCAAPGDNPTETLVIYAHGFVFPQQPLAVPTTEGGLPIRQFVAARGFAYATTSYYTNGLVRPQLGVKDLRELVTIYTRLYGRPERVLLVGFSNGALLAVHALEQNPGRFDGALASCGPVGSYTDQVGYLGDLYVLFEHLFPTALSSGPFAGVDPGGPEGVPAAFFERLVALATAAGVTPERYLAGYLQGVLTAGPNVPRTAQLLAVAAATPEIDPDYNTFAEGLQAVISGVLYNVFVTNDALAKLGGPFYDNATRVYVGSADDAALNASIARYEAAPNAAAQLRAHYDTAARLRDPVVALHTVRDPLVPFWQEGAYAERLDDPSLFTVVQVARFGHCAFTPAEVNAGLDALLEAVPAEGVRSSEPDVAVL